MAVSERTYVVPTNGPTHGAGGGSRTNDLDLPGACNAIEIEGYDPAFKHWVLCCDDRDTRARFPLPGRFGFIGMATGPVFLDNNIEPDYDWKPDA